ncbi:MAG TPA: PAS domain-containing protein [Candidatus Acidoferrales bacterium]|nr:PAS domain-containing protein [Candidatus Acidoferrales bacterium]
MTAGSTRSDVRQRYGALVDCIADLLGPSAEVVLHDVSRTDHSVVLIRNGLVTGRSVGAPLTDLGFYMLRESDRRIETLGVYYSQAGNGKRLKCNAANLRDSRGKVEAILCINIDVTDEASAEGQERSSPFTEHYETSIRRVIDTLVRHATEGRGRELSAEAKVEVVRALESRGVFLARGAIKQVAASLGIAPPTVYKYIQQVRHTRALSAR